MRVLAVVPGPEHHGVVRHGRTVAALVAARGPAVTVARDVEVVPPGGHDLTHVQFTDALFGPDVTSAAAAFEAWSATAPRPLVVTLHDVPDGGGEPGRDARRRLAYRRVVRASDAVVVGTIHEATAARLLDGPEPTVVPLPFEDLPPPGSEPAWAGRRTLGVLGFVYPGKGHAEALSLAAGSGGGVAVVAVGAVSPGHAPLRAELDARAGDLGVDLLVTGALTDPDLHAAALAVTIPLAAYQTSGSSASLVTWLACGRRPLATTTPQVRELAARHPGAVVACASGDELARAVAAALATPETTWSGGQPSRPDVGGAHLAVYRRALGGP